MKQRLTILIIVILLSLVLVVPGSAGPPVGTIKIETEADFTSVPIGGNFEVVEGADELGCWSGTYVDYPAGILPPTRGAITKVFTCEKGGTGTFTANFQPFVRKPGPGDLNGHWNFTDSSGDFAGLHGEGDLSVDFVMNPPPSAVETLSGNIHYEPSN